MNAPPIAAQHPRLPPAGALGRAGKLAVGALQLSFVYAIATHLAGILRVVPPVGGFWVFIAWAFWLVAPTVNLGAIRERTSGSRARRWAVGAFVLITIAGRTVSGT
ncbi:MAG TPA: hypothetical protein VF737_03955 [Gemmatimonadaceae bacterium]|jgi:hypothetical protein